MPAQPHVVKVGEESYVNMRFFIDNGPSPEKPGVVQYTVFPGRVREIVDPKYQRNLIRRLSRIAGQWDEHFGEPPESGGLGAPGAEDPKRGARRGRRGRGLLPRGDAAGKALVPRRGPGGPGGDV